ncbi:hypothetical protein B0H11DRAFT_1684905, partial [Mycena galericulata]
GARWDPKVLRHGILVFDDPRAEVRMRFWASMFEQVKTMKDLLTIALQFAIPFWIYYEMENVSHFRAPVSAVEALTFPPTLEPGYREVQLKWQSGGAATLVQYKHLAGAVTMRPHAGTFLHHGGFISRIALWLNPDLVRQTMAGPSTRVSQHHRGQILTGAVQISGPSTRPATLTRDQVSEDEIKLLLGYIDKGGPDEDLTLFPPLYLLEQ